MGTLLAKVILRDRAKAEDESTFNLWDVKVIVIYALSLLGASGYESVSDESAVQSMTEAP